MVSNSLYIELGTLYLIKNKQRQIYIRRKVYKAYSKPYNTYNYSKYRRY